MGGRKHLRLLHVRLLGLGLWTLSQTQTQPLNPQLSPITHHYAYFLHPTSYFLLLRPITFDSELSHLTHRPHPHPASTSQGLPTERMARWYLLTYVLTYLLT